MLRGDRATLMCMAFVHTASQTQGLRQERIVASTQYRDGVFRNPSGALPGLQTSGFALMKEYALARVERVPTSPLAVRDPRPTWQRAAAQRLRMTWLGHSTMLIESAGHAVLTDPVWGRRASPLQIAGPKRFWEPPVRIADLPPLDAIIVSHDHYDHLCRESVRALAATQTAPFVTSLGVGAHLQRFGVPAERIIELDWGEAWVAPGSGVRLVAEAAQHFSGRGMSDRNRTLWSSWVMQTERHRVFFSGDTGLEPTFANVSKRHGPFDATMLEVGAYHPAWGQIHLGPANALVAFDALGGGTLVPVHWATFNLALHAWREPGDVLLQQAGGRRMWMPAPGEAFWLDDDEPKTPWWRG